MLPGSFTLGLLLLPHHLSLVLRRQHWLTNTLALCFLICYAFNSRLLHLLTAQLRHLLSGALIASACLSRQVFDSPLLDLLPPQLVNLLSCSSIATRRLSRQIGHLSFSRLLGGEIWRLRLWLRRRCCAFVS